MALFFIVNGMPFPLILENGVAISAEPNDQSFNEV